MFRISGRLRAVLVLVALLAPLLGFAAPAGADDVAETTTRLFRSAGPFPRTIDINARVRSDAGVPTGMVTFYEIGTTDPIDAPVALDSTGLATVTVGTPVCGPFAPCEPVRYRAVFEPTGAFAPSAGAEGDGLPLLLEPEPTVLGLGGPLLLRISLTTAIRVFTSDGVPAEGALVYFTTGGNLDSADQSTVSQVCFAAVDRNGLATCKGAGGRAAVSSLLGTSVWANVLAPDLSGGFEVVKLPVITLGR